ncbi:MAG: head GIN domain-containing protein [Bacteroidales bacterium]
MNIKGFAIFMIIFLAGMGPVHSQNRTTLDLEDFSKLNVSGRMDVELIRSESKQMSITSIKGDPEDVTVEIKDGELYLKVPTRINKDDIIQIRLPYQLLSRIETTSGAKLNSADELRAGALELIARTGGKIELSIHADSLTARVTQVSDIILYGNVKTQYVTVLTGGNYLAYDLVSRDTYIKVSAGAQGKVTASRILDATANSKGYIGYIGDPDNTVLNTSLGGTIVPFSSRKDADVN